MVGFAVSTPVAASAGEIEVKARPSSCTYGIADAYRTWAICKKGNGGAFRAIAVCKDPETGKKTTAEGNWQRTGGTVSFAYCNGSTNPSSAGVETKP
ncbi:hypothetical protein B1C81_39620 [Streptomyces sp. HG99]|nr:hypothetical protein B1C81_39620 [Streptomyces sp. HG99]